MVPGVEHTGSRAEDFYGESAQFSGDGFSGMHFILRVILRAVPEDASWVARAQEAGPWLDHAGYIEHLHESQNVRPLTYQSVEPGLFEDIVTGRLPPGDGPASEGSGPPIRPRGAQ
jgi:cytochrome o ubiquinol oxidase subunit 2